MKGAEKLIAPNPSPPAPARPNAEVAAAAHFTPVVAAPPATKEASRPANQASVATVPVAVPKELVFKGPPRKPTSSRWLVWIGLFLSLGVMGAVEWYYAQRRRKAAEARAGEVQAPETGKIDLAEPTKETIIEPSAEPVPVPTVAAANAPA
jgi:hypothetical protein